jgi:Ni/Fe-hydrogenase subunit HybB-like protein
MSFPGTVDGFDVCGGLAAGGVLTAIVYIFNLKQFAPIIRPTVLTAFLDTLLWFSALMFDLGQPIGSGTR